MAFLHLAFCFDMLLFSSWFSLVFIASQHALFHTLYFVFDNAFNDILSCANLSLRYSSCFLGMALVASIQRRPRSNGRSRLTFFARQFQGASESFYLIFAYPLHKHLVLNIILFIADEDADFTGDICRLSCSSSFMWKQCMTFRCVDTPSLASEDDSW